MPEVIQFKRQAHNGPSGIQLLLIAAATLFLCSCRHPGAYQTSHVHQPRHPAAINTPLPSPAPSAANSHAMNPPRRPPLIDQPQTHAYDTRAVATSHAVPTLPPQAYVGPPVPTDPRQTTQQWRPPAIAGTWPHDEYLFDGGDKDVGVVVDPDWTVRGLDLEDTVGHFDTLDGRTLVSPSNRVPIYAPRFAAVRKVYGLKARHTAQQSVGIEQPIAPHLHRDRSFARTETLQEQPTGQIGTKAPSIFRETLDSEIVDNTQHLRAFGNVFQPHEDFQIIRLGSFLQSEKPRLTERIEAALSWTIEQAVQVIVDGKTAIVQKGLSKPEEAKRFEDPPGTPRLRVIKVASKSDAAPGETVDFTIRFDNVGDEMIGNVTVIDNLTTRLEFVDGSAECSLNANFKTAENDGQSLVLRWEITDPMDVGEGGIIRFQCRVR